MNIEQWCPIFPLPVLHYSSLTTLPYIYIYTQLANDQRIFVNFLTNVRYRYSLDFFFFRSCSGFLTNRYWCDIVTSFTNEALTGALLLKVTIPTIGNEFSFFQAKTFCLNPISISVRRWEWEQQQRAAGLLHPDPGEGGLDAAPWAVPLRPDHGRLGGQDQQQHRQRAATPGHQDLEDYAATLRHSRDNSRLAGL